MNVEPEQPDERPGTDDLLGRLYDELRRLAHRRLAGEGPGQTLQATALVHEAWLRLAGEGTGAWASEHQFYAAAATAMRRILVERARARGSLKRGGGRGRVPLEELESAEIPLDGRLLDLDAALAKLEQVDPAAAEVVALRYFAGLGEAEAAALVGRSERSVRRDLATARLYLAREIERGGEDAAGDAEDGRR